MENKNVVGPAGGNHGLRIQADKNVKKLTVKYANKIPVNENKTQAHTTTLYIVAFESISISSYDFLFKKNAHTYTFIICIVFSNLSSKSHRREKAHRKIGKQETFRAGRSGKSRRSMERQRTVCRAPDIWILYEAARQTDFCSLL